MNYLLDTHAILWFLNGEKILLSSTAKNVIEDQKHTKFVSLATVWEVGIKISIGKLQFPENTNGFVTQIQKNGFELLPINADYIIAIEQIPHIHRDPYWRCLMYSIIAVAIRKL